MLWGAVGCLANVHAVYDDVCKAHLRVIHDFPTDRLPT